MKPGSGKANRDCEVRWSAAPRLQVELHETKPILWRGWTMGTQVGKLARWALPAITLVFVFLGSTFFVLKHRSANPSSSEPSPRESRVAHLTNSTTQPLNPVVT